MTTSRSSHKPMRFTFRQGLRSLTAAVAVILGGAITFFTALFSLITLFTRSPIYDENYNVTGYIDNKDTYHYLLFDANEYVTPILLMIIAAGGVLAAICTFNFITSKKMVNVYYSLGITRTKLFCGKYFSGLLLILLAIFLPMLVLFIGNIVTVGFSLSLFKAVAYYLFKFTLTAFTSYTITSAVFAAVGTTFETAIFSAIILFIPDIFLYSIQVLMDKFLYGNPYGNDFIYANSYDYGTGSASSSLPDKFSYLSPIFWGKDQINEFAFAEKADAKELVPVIFPDFKHVLIWFVICIAVFFLAVLLFNKRKAEICGFIGTNRYLNSAVSLLAAFAAFCVLIQFFDDLILGLVVGAVAFALVHLLLEIIVLRDLKKFARGLYKLPIGIAVSIAIVFVFNAGLFGFSQKIPDVSDIKSVAVTYVGSASEYGLYSDNYSYSWCDLNSYAYSQNLAGEFRTEKDINAVVDVHKLITETDESDRTLKNEVQFVYTLKDGSTLKRSFDSVSPESYKELLFLEDSDYYTEILINYFKGDIKEFKEYDDSPEYVFAQAQTNLRQTYSVEIYSKYLDKVFTVILSESDRTKLLDALYTDVMNRSAKEKYYPGETPVGYIYFLSQDGSTGAEDQSEITETPFSAKHTEFSTSSVWQPNFSTHITSDMTNTIKVLKDMGIYDKLGVSPEFVSAEVMDAQSVYDEVYGKEIYMQANNSRSFLSSFTSSTPTTPGQDWYYYDTSVDTLVDGTVVTDKNTISELMNCAYTVYEQDDIDKGWFVSFKTADGSTSLCYIPEGKLPASVK